MVGRCVHINIENIHPKRHCDWKRLILPPRCTQSSLQYLTLQWTVQGHFPDDPGACTAISHVPGNLPNLRSIVFYFQRKKVDPFRDPRAHEPCSVLHMVQLERGTLLASLGDVPKLELIAAHSTEYGSMRIADKTSTSCSCEGSHMTRLSAVQS